MADTRSGFYQKLSAYPLMTAERRQELLGRFYATQLAIVEKLVAYLVPLYRYFAEELERRNTDLEIPEEVEIGLGTRVGRLKGAQLKQVAKMLMQLKDAQEQKQSTEVDLIRSQLREFLLGVDYSLLSLMSSASYTEPAQEFVVSLSEAQTIAKELHDLILSADEDRDALFKGNWRLVMEIARRFEAFGSKLDLDELVQEGNTGLLAAIDKFNPTLNFQLSTMAASWIQAKIRRGLDNLSETIRTPVYKRQHRKLVQRAEMDLLTKSAPDQAGRTHAPMELMTGAEKLFGRTIEDTAIAEKTGLTLDEVQELRRLYPETVSINATVDGSDDSDSRERQDMIADKANEEAPRDKGDRNLFFAMLTRLVDDLPLGHQVVLSALNGLPIRKQSYKKLVLERYDIMRRKGENLLRGMPVGAPKATIQVFR